MMGHTPKTDIVIIEDATGSNAERKKARILLAEDSPDARALMKRSLEKSGFEVHDVENGKLCLEKFVNSEFDIVVVDFVMPEKNGLEVLQEIRKHRSPEELPVVMITAKQKIELVKKAIQQGVNDFFIKPIKTHEFVNRIEKHLMHMTIEDVRHILRSLNVADPSILSTNIQTSLESQKLTAFPFEYQGVKCAAILDKGRNPHIVAKGDEKKIEQDLTILGRGVFLWSIIWPRNAAPRFTLPKHDFKLDDDFAALLEE